MTTDTAQEKLACEIVEQYHRRKDAGLALALKLREETPKVKQNGFLIDKETSAQASAYRAAIAGIERWIREEYEATRSAIDSMGFLEDFFGE